ncbi:GNAT family N-acetyltransferase [Chishuiella changwenlii]|uniref:GNAT family N-acetyltransferase n=1 Tax=Chishuiella changwenlii TaxID=1434701 RepID=UPI002FD95996
MKIATIKDRDKIVDILFKSFVDVRIPNSINFIVGLNNDRDKRLRALMEYQFDRTILEGKAIISDDDKGVILFLESNTFSFKKIILDFKLLFKCIGIRNVFNVLKREKILKNNHPNQKFIHLWLMAVNPEFQGQGNGSKLLQETLKYYKNELIYLETTTQENLSFYTKNKFTIFKENFNLDYPLYFLKYV